MVAEIAADVILREDLQECLERIKSRSALLGASQQLLSIFSTYFRVLSRAVGLNFVALSIRMISLIRMVRLQVEKFVSFDSVVGVEGSSQTIPTI